MGAEVPAHGRKVLQLAICLAAGSVASVLLGQDANWDLRNYHLYNPYALLNGRIGIDLLPAGIQSTFNPLLDVPYYVLATGPLAEAPRVLAGLAGLPFGALVFATLRLACWMLGPLAGPGQALPWLATAIAGTAAATWSEIGTTFNDIPVAALLLGGFVLAASRPGFSRYFGAGAMLGAAAALKLTAAVFLPGLVLGLLVLEDGWRARASAAACLAAGALLAAVALGLPWALTLFRLYGSPVFPLMNALFRSDWYPPIDILDTRFLPRTLGQALFYPFYWITLQDMLVTEPPFRDARLALAMLCIPFLAVAWWRGRLPRRTLAVLVAAAACYAAWLPTFSILRYAIPLEALASLLVVATLRLAFPRVSPVATALLFGALLWHTEPPDWWRIPFGPRTLDVERVQLPANSLVLAIGAPVSMVLPFMDAPGHRALGLTKETLPSRGYRLFAELDRAIRTHDGPLFALTDEARHLGEAAPEFGLAADASSCRPIRAPLVFNGEILLCPMQRAKSSRESAKR